MTCSSCRPGLVIFSVSLHVNFNDHHDIRGASIYTLSEDASDREAGKLAEQENMSDVIAGVNLTGENSPVASIRIHLARARHHEPLGALCRDGLG